MSDIPAPVLNEILEYLSQRENANVSNVIDHVNSNFEFDNAEEIREPIVGYLQSLNEVGIAKLKNDGSIKINKITPPTEVEAKSYQLKVQAAVTDEVQPGSAVATTSRQSRKQNAETAKPTRSRKRSNSRKSTTKNPAMRRRGAAKRGRSRKKEETTVPATPSQTEDEAEMPAPKRSRKTTPKKPATRRRRTATPRSRSRKTETPTVAATTARQSRKRPAEDEMETPPPKRARKTTPKKPATRRRATSRTRSKPRSKSRKPKGRKPQTRYRSPASKRGLGM